MKPDTPIRSVFDDGTGLDIAVKAGEILAIHGLAEYNSITARLSIERKDTGALYRGTISIINPATGRVLVSEVKRRARTEAGKPTDDRYCYASEEVKCNSNDPKFLADSIKQHITSLIEENLEQLKGALRVALPPDVITPFLAAQLYVEDFLSRNYPDSPPENNHRRAATIRKYCGLMANLPMRDFTAKDIDRFVRQHKISDDHYRLLSGFWSHSLRTKVYSGELPFTTENHRKRISYDTQNRKASIAETLTSEQLSKAFELINHEDIPKGIHCGFALIASGFTPEDALEKTWRDIAFRRATDRAWVNHQRPELAGSMHDFSRPMAPESARFLRKVRNYLRANYGDAYLDWPIVFDGLPPNNKAFDTKTLTSAIRNLLIRAGVPNDMFDSGKYTRESVAVALLHNTYEHHLRFVCGLNSDDDTREYLLGHKLRSSTFTAYVCHTDSTAQEHLHTALQPMAAPRKYIAPKSPQPSPGRAINAFFPDMTNQRVHVTARIKLGPRESLSIQCPHGVIGTVRAIPNTPFKEENSNEFLERL